MPESPARDKRSSLYCQVTAVKSSTTLAPEGATTRVGYDLARKFQISMKKLASDKHSSLIQM